MLLLAAQGTAAHSICQGAAPAKPCPSPASSDANALKGNAALGWRLLLHFEGDDRWVVESIASPPTVSPWQVGTLAVSGGILATVAVAGDARYCALTVCVLQVVPRHSGWHGPQGAARAAVR